MKPSLNTKTPISNYLLLPLAIIQSEIFWFYSAVYCLLLESVITHKQSTPLRQELRHRSLSDPQIKFDDKDNNAKDSIKLTEEEKAKALRRESLPEPSLHIRHRPTIHDELNGITCPPVWWQKTRVKFGHTPVHSDVIIEDDNDDDLSSLSSCLATPTFDDVIHEEPAPMSRTTSNYNPFVNIINRPLPTSPISSIFTPTHSAKSSFSSTSKRSIIQVEHDATPPLSPQLSTTSNTPPKSKSKKKFKKMLKKLNTALHIPHHRRND